MSDNEGTKVEEEVEVIGEDGKDELSVVDDLAHKTSRPSNYYDEEEQPNVCRRNYLSKKPSIKHHFRRREIRSICCPHGFTKYIIPLLLTVIALTLTGIGSCSCNYFKGASIGFTGGSYGIWTIQDSDDKCQLWDVLFFSYHLDPALVVARVMSMSAMMLGLAMVTTMAQAMQYHIASWGTGIILFITFIVSLSTTSIFNVWMVFWLSTYIIYVLIVRSLFIHPFHRRISARGSKFIAGCFILCMLLTILTLVVLKSDYCTCSSLAAGQLEGRVTGDPCEGTCRLTVGGYMMILASFFWLTAAIATERIGVQPEMIHENPTKTQSMYGGFQPKSITTRTKNFARKLQYSPGEASIGEEGNDSDKNGNGDAQTECKRTCCQKLCCDFRVKERSRHEKCLYWTFRIGLAFFFVIYIFILIVLIGSRVENSNAERAPDTTPNFVLDPVCAFSPLDTAEEFKTFPTADEARASNYSIAHCGPCAFCSNIEDIQTYVETRKTIAASAKKCGPTALFGSYDAVVNCLEDRIHFSRDCTFCWADNIKNTGHKCIFTCMKTLFTGFMSDNNVPGAGQQGWLNHCLQCDEKVSGTAFVTCSGVARRRLGISSEIERNPEQQCSTVDVNWLTYFGDNV